MAARALKKEPPKQLLSEEDRATLREHLTQRLIKLHNERRRSRNRIGGGEAAEEAFYEGSEMEVFFLFDDLLGEQPPEKPWLKKPKSS